MGNVGTAEIETFAVAIIGAGICGLAIAQELLGAGHRSWRIIDKGRSVGGRLATRRIDGQKFDHGAQFFTARSPSFIECVNQWMFDGIVREWTKGFNQHGHHSTNSNRINHHNHKLLDGHSRYVGIGGMNQIPKYLASKLPSENILVNQKINQLRLVSENVSIRGENGFDISAKSIVITTPLPQALELMNSLGDIGVAAALKATLSTVTYDPCIALMGMFNEDEMPLDILPLQCPNDTIAFLADNHSKGIASERGALTVHLAPEASRGMFTAHDTVIVDFICHQLRQLFGLKKISRPISFEIQRWRYAAPQRTLEKPFVELKLSNPGGSRIIVAGEAFGGPKIEGAFLSGHAVADHLLSLVLG